MKAKTYKLDAALALLASHGFTYESIREETYQQNPLVTIRQNWTPRGKEFADLRRARGKWAGTSIGTVYRDRNPYA
jgi:hypothetical protein